MDACIFCGGKENLYPYQDGGSGAFFLICGECLFGTRPASKKAERKDEDEEPQEGYGQGLDKFSGTCYHEAGTWKGEPPPPQRLDKISWWGYNKARTKRGGNSHEGAD